MSSLPLYSRCLLFFLTTWMWCGFVFPPIFISEVELYSKAHAGIFPPWFEVSFNLSLMPWFRNPPPLQDSLFPIAILLFQLSFLSGPDDLSCPNYVILTQISLRLDPIPNLFRYQNLLLTICTLSIFPFFHLFSCSHSCLLFVISQNNTPA